MAIKLIKACKELNIGMATLTSWCEKNGHPIASDPNVRIDDDLYLLLAKEFSKDVALKIEADRQAAERQAREAAEKEAAEAARRAAEAEAAKKAAEEAAKRAAEAEAKRAAEEAERAAKAKQAEEEAKAAEAKREAEKAQAQAQEQAKAQEKPQEKPKPKIFTLSKPEVTDGPKVIGKIDLDSIDT